MPVNLIILEQGEGLGNRTKAIRLTEAKMQAAVVAEHNSPLKQIFLFLCVTCCRFISSVGERDGDVSCVVTLRRCRSEARVLFLYYYYSHLDLKEGSLCPLSFITRSKHTLAI